ncbi:outer membrane protein assembly factor BamD [Geobacter sp. OR-1]|uniref:outer membrane protein assembly factor BamD n=1 Tax=Geobacter sp. OR-1 TaxID=1266765 RepID=UPI0005431BBC|nr:outer membrane protein assembly factor BamD [Geobacter sp. OR-1]GAM09846.1 outer membrane protein assembly factor BamD [Geobacter sp. OR-1]
MNIKIKIALLPALLLAIAGCSSTSSAVKSATEYFKDGEQAYTEKNYEQAIALWKKVKDSYISPELTTKAELNIADAMYNNGNFIEAAAEYENFRKLHPNHEKAAYALYRLGMCNFQQITGIDTDQTSVSNAVHLFNSFLETYPTSDLAKEVRQKLDEAVTVQLRHEIYVGRFYMRTGKYAAAIKRLEGALAKFPGKAADDEALLYLGQSYLMSGDKAKGREAFNRLATEYPASPFVGDAKKFMEKNY